MAGLPNCSIECFGHGSSESKFEPWHCVNWTPSSRGVILIRKKLKSVNCFPNLTSIGLGTFWQRIGLDPAHPSRALAISLGSLPQGSARFGEPRRAISRRLVEGRWCLGYQAAERSETVTPEPNKSDQTGQKLRITSFINIHGGVNPRLVNVHREIVNVRSHSAIADLDEFSALHIREVVGKLLYHVHKITKDDGYTRGRAGNAALNGITALTARDIAYVAVQNWGRTDGTFRYPDFYWSIVDLLQGKGLGIKKITVETQGNQRLDYSPPHQIPVAPFRGRMGRDSFNNEHQRGAAPLDQFSDGDQVNRYMQPRQIVKGVE
ncbi:hypothetical protein B0H13DRAFT_1851037 [Mycena leptocephala]|nr:hypothetical protein B0H13DRAFT_1851037 [Mycena leptocephala]